MFGFSYLNSLLRQRFGAQELRRQPEMDMVMLDEEQDLQYSRDGEDGALAVLYDLVINSALRLAPSDGDALDVATGSGQLLGKMARCLPGLRFTATDLSPHMLSLAAANAQRYGAANVEFRAQSMYELESLGRRFDLITFSFAMHHCDSLAHAVRVLDGIAACLKPGGAVLIFDILRPKTGALAVDFADRYNNEQGSWYYQDSLDSYKAAFTFEEVEEVLSRSKLRGCKHVQPSLGNFFQMAYLKGAPQPRRPSVNHLRRLWQKRDYALLRLGFLGKLP